MPREPMKVRPFLELDRVLEYETPTKRDESFWSPFGWLNPTICWLLGSGFCLIVIGLMVGGYFDDLALGIGVILFSGGIRLWRKQPPRW